MKYPKTRPNSAQNMKFSIKDLFSKCDQILNGELHFCALCVSLLKKVSLTLKCLVVTKGHARLNKPPAKR